MPVLAVAAVSARPIAEAAARDGFEVVALDVFGDADTRRAASRWHRIDDASDLRIDPLRTLAALRQVATTRHDAIGWLAGAGFEGLPDLLEAGSRVLPLLGTAAADVRRLREPATFFGFLRRHGLAHPPVVFERPADPAGWLSKDASGSGGWHIRPLSADRTGADAGAVPDSTGAAAVGAVPCPRYFQRAARGEPMSATFLARPGRVDVLGINRLTVRPLGSRPFVYHGVIGPLPVAAGVAAQVDHALQLIGHEFRLRGLGSLDFLLDGDTALWLEVNPRWPASAELYEGRIAGGLIAAHLCACRGAAPAVGATASARDVRGTEIVFSPRPLQLDGTAAQAISQWPGSHDHPPAGTRLAAGEPMCSVSAAGVDADAATRALAQSRAGLLRAIGGNTARDDNDDDDRTETTR